MTVNNSLCLGVFDNFISTDDIFTNYGDYRLTREYIGASPDDAMGVNIRLDTVCDYNYNFIINTIFGYLENSGECDNLTRGDDFISFDDFTSPDHTHNICKKIIDIIGVLDD